MHDAHEFLRNLALVLATAGITTLVFQRLRQPVVFGYLLAGMLVGPHVPVPLAADAEIVRTLADVGVILLMFALGLDFSLRRLWQLGPTSGMIALPETSALLAVGYLLGRAFGWTHLESVFTGAIIAISSTTIIVKAFEEQAVTGRFTRIVFGVLILEDLIAILLLAVLTAVAVGGGLTAGQLVGTVGRLAVFLVALIAVGLMIVPRLMRAVVRLGRPETTIVTAIGLCFATAWLAASFGYSVALGAFVAGMLVSESGHAKRVEQLVEPVRDVFAAIFFVSIGVLIDPALVARHWGVILILTAVVITGKTLAVSVGAFLAGHGTRAAVQTGMSMAQIGEFSFIIASLGISLGATRDFLFPVAVAVSALTTLTTPWLIRAAGSVASLVDRKLPRPLQNFSAFYASWMEGYSRARPTGQPSRMRRLALLIALDLVAILAVVLAVVLWRVRMTGWLERQMALEHRVALTLVLAGAAAVIAPLTFALVRTTRALGQAAALRALPPPLAGKVDMAVASRRAIVVAWQLAILGLLAAPIGALLALFLPASATFGLLAIALLASAISFWRSATNLQGHTRAGAEVIVAALGKQMAGAKAERAAAGLPAARPLAQVATLLPGLGTPASLRLSAGDHAVGKTLAELDVRDRTNAAVLVIVRDGKEILLPVGADRLEEGDLLAIAGTEKAVRAATQLLVGGGGGE